ncbi:Replication initiator protein [Mycobacteroides abscessus subsp. bolletii]|uniref:replication initiator n=1 Tax=Mycobacteroides abscessus TaxID=36809 RepID=UPI0009275536|nr:replication initiator [Mycobacteroides abscessus]SHQ33420.1 Replication initiator protein [Mycobacteroides abscessus subsp. bolletii]SHS08346.1 Replication initiator protein [Mycobacteroides abscessus subsp. bolletii]SHS82715.1 Replication initiator protein [Mycobacteroides abscessus subsp. bolletii]SHS86563.1 Replication initiator protein [Mycobacteroides abscessus subsp. bolletii]SHX72105.1 Replication initiator protein [Mycobacteroides abscessus subsp. bolletii]
MSNTNGVGDPAIILPGIPTTLDQSRVVAQILRRASSLGFDAWWQRAQSVGFCANPIQLVGTDAYGREKMVWARCNNRRANVCPSCSDLYARDTWQLVAAGTAGGRHGISPDVSDRPQVFATLTAPSFGAVHSAAGNVCRDHRRVGEFRRCPHGKPLWCTTNHNHDDPMIGQPSCSQCYDYTGHVLFTWHLPELWRRFTITLRRAITKTLKAAGVEPKSVRVSFVKVVEMQARAVPHVHALIRLDPAIPATDLATTTPGDHEDYGPAATRGGGEPRHQTDPSRQPPISASELAALIQHTARTLTYEVPDPTAENPDDADSLTVRFGDQIDTQPLTAETPCNQTESNAAGSTGRLSPRRVAGYLAKYVTKSLADFGISARRLSTEAIADLNVTEHVRTILTTVADLSDRARRDRIPALTGIGRWLHTLGYRGHITTKSRRYSVTMGKLRGIRASWTRAQTAKHTTPQQQSALDAGAADGPVWWEFDRAGHTTPGDRTLVISAALRHIHTRRTGLVESRALRDAEPPGARDG